MHKPRAVHDAPSASLQKRIPVEPEGEQETPLPPPDRHLVQSIAGTHDSPRIGAVQASESVRMPAPEHVPALHVAIVHVRVWVPAELQPFVSLRVHGPNIAHVSPPHESPVVARTQASVSMRKRMPHAPAVQTGMTTRRVRVPDSSQVSEKPPQRLHASAFSAPHASPSVARAHPAVSISSSIAEPQTPDAHACEVKLREREPLRLQTSAYPHAP